MIKIDWEDGYEIDKINIDNLYIINQNIFPIYFPLRIRIIIEDYFFYIS